MKHNLDALFKEIGIKDKATKQYFLDKIEKTPFLQYVPINNTIRDFHKSKARIKGLFGGNRSGKSRSGAQEVVWWATGTHPFKKVPKPPVHIWVVSLDFPSSRDIMQPLITRLLGERYLKQWYATDKIAELMNGSTIGFKSNDSGWDKFQGTSKNLILFDEEPDYSVYEECRMRVIDTKGDLIFTMTPTHGMTWIYDEIYEPWELGTNPNIECFMTSSYDNPYIDSAELDDIKKNFPEDQQQVRLHGKFVEFSGLVYREFDRNIHVVDRFEIPSNWTRIRAIDPGINNPTACIWWAISPDGDHYIYDEYEESDLNIETNTKNIKAQTGLDRISVTYIDPSACNRNPAHPELKSIRDEYSRFKLYTKPANNDVLYGLNKVRSLMKVDETTGQPLLHIFKDCVKTIREISRYRWDEHRFHKDDKNNKEKPKKVMDHLMDAMRYIAASNPMHSGLYDVVDMIEDVETRSTRKYTMYG